MGFPRRTLLGLFAGCLTAVLAGQLWVPSGDPLDQLGQVGEQLPHPLSVGSPTFLMPAKPEGEVRAFVVGASLTYGLPYEPEAVTSYATLLSVGYRAVLDRQDIHVRPEARPAWTSEQILEKAGQLLAWNPDLLVVVLGTNEYVNRIVHGKALLAEGMLARVEESVAHGQHLWAAFSREVLGEAVAAGGGGDFAALLRKTRPGHPAMGGLPIGPRDRRLLLDRMQRGIRELHARCKKAGTRLVLAHSAQDLKSFTPWCNDLDGPVPEVDRLIDQVWRVPAPAFLPEVEALLERYPARADLHQARGRLLLAAGRKEEARAEFVRSLDLDLAPLHHTSDIREALAEVAESEGLTLLDLNDALVDEDGIPGGERFLDAAHVDLEGHRHLAMHLAQRLQGQGLPPLPDGWEERFEHAIHDHQVENVSDETKETGRARIAFNGAKYLLFFGNFRDALHSFERALIDLPEGETRSLYEHAQRRMRESAGEEDEDEDEDEER